jgi:predicted RNase H-like nuclease (RuvC/YqgF family)
MRSEIVLIATNMIEQIILTIVTTLIGYFVGYRKSQNEVEGGRLENLEKSIRIYQVVIDDLGKKVEELTAHIVRLEATIDSLKKENNKLKYTNGL